MELYSTKNKSDIVSLKEAVLRGMAKDDGLYMPRNIVPLPTDFFASIQDYSFSDIAFHVAENLIAGEIEEADLRAMIVRAINFDAPLVKLTDSMYCLELFHGPTLAFKDFGARFMAELLTYFTSDYKQKLIVLVATSGDTGSAVAAGFLNNPAIDVVILYPSAKVSFIQEKQLTTMGNNVSALEIKGSFDDCQRLVKLAFCDAELQSGLKLTSANSINIARLIPQSFYYFYAFSKLPKDCASKDLIFSVPSGNFGNLTAGLLAKRMGLPVKRFIASTNINDIIPKFLKSGIFAPAASKATISNAMDVGNPNNFARINDLFSADIESLRSEVVGYSFSDEDTRKAMRELLKQFNYICDPHGAVAYLGLKEYFRENQAEIVGVFLETAHPAKFLDIVQEELNQAVKIPARLKEVLDKEKKSILMENDFSSLKNYLLEKYS